MNSYERRLDGREIYTAGSLIAYAQSICMNGIAPFLAFRGAINKQFTLNFIAFSSVLFFYWLLGVKAPFAYTILAFLVGYLARKNHLRYFLYLR